MPRHPTPTHLKVLRKVRSDRIPVGEPQPANGPILCPEWLSNDAKQLWYQLAPDLIAQKVLTPWDVPAFAAMCTCWSFWRSAVAQVQRDGIAVVGHNNRTSKHPAGQIARDNLSLFNNLAARFGLTPSDRSKLTIDGQAQRPADDLLTQPSEPWA